MTTNFEITYSQMEIEDRNKVLDFLRIAYPDTPRQSDAEFWNWHYLEHPNSRPGEIPVWLAKVGDRIVGQLATIPVELSVAAEKHPAIWILDLMVDPEFRRRGIMKKLVLEANKSYEYMLGSATRRQHSAAMLTGLGWKVFSDIPRFHRLLFPANAVRSSLGPIRTVINSFSFPLRRNRVRSPSSFSISRPRQIDARFEELWNDARAQWGCSIGRSVEYLRWQFERQPGKRFELIGCEADGRLVGYAILFFRRANANDLIEKAAISDICYHASDAGNIIDALLSASVKLAIERRVGGLVTDALDPLLQKKLTAAGFHSVTSGLEVMAIGPGNTELLYDPKQWHLTRGDSDISIFEEPNK